MKRIKAYTSFTRKEKIGITILTGIILTLIIIRVSMHVWVNPENNTAEQTRVANAWENYKNKYQDDANTEAANTDYITGIININTADSATLLRLKGIGLVNVNRILTYRRNYGRFTDVEQIRAICTMPGTTFNELKGHISLSDE